MASINPITGVLGEKNAGHLLRRITYGPTRADIESFSEKTPEEALVILFENHPLPEPPKDPATGETWINPKPGPENSDENDLLTFFMGWHLEQMRSEPLNAREKLTFFLHSHLPVSLDKVPYSTAIYHQNQLYRHYAFGSFKELFKKVVYDNAMLVYIDNYLNSAENPNENFAREMFELYTIGKGPQIAPGDYTNYTEQDIKAAARVLTGYFYEESFETYYEDLLPQVKIASGQVYTWGDQDLAVLHDAGSKNFSEKFDNTVIEPDEVLLGYATKNAVLNELDELIEMIFSKSETARFLCRKLYRYFVYYKIDDEIEQDIINPLADTMIASGYELKPVIEQLLKSRHFYDADNSATTDDHTGALIKSPVEVLLTLFRFFNVQLPSDIDKLYIDTYKEIILGYMHVMGMPFYFPPDVAGFPAYFQGPSFNRNWITPTNLAFRYWLIYPLLDGLRNQNNELLLQLDILQWIETPGNITDPSNAETLVDELTAYMLASPLPQERLDYFLNSVFLDGFPVYYWTNEWNKYQESGNAGVVRLQLAKLLVSITQSPEIQLS